MLEVAADFPENSDRVVAQRFYGGGDKFPCLAFILPRHIDGRGVGRYCFRWCRLGLAKWLGLGREKREEDGWITGTRAVGVYYIPHLITSFLLVENIFHVRGVDDVIAICKRKLSSRVDRLLAH